MIKDIKYAFVLLVVLVSVSWCWLFVTAEWDQVDVYDARGRDLEFDISTWDKRLISSRVERDMSMINLTTDQKVDYTIRFSSSENKRNKAKARTFNAYMDSDSVWLIEDVPLTEKGRYTIRVRDNMFGQNTLKDVSGVRFVDSD